MSTYVVRVYTDGDPESESVLGTFRSRINADLFASKVERVLLPENELGDRMAVTVDKVYPPDLGVLHALGWFGET